jgi:hypothetical protein
MNERKRFIKNIILRAIEYYNGFLRDYEKLEVDETFMYDFNDAGAIIGLVKLFFFKNFGIEIKIDEYSEETRKRNLDELCDYILENIEDFKTWKI